MLIFWQIIFWFSIFLILHSYVIFPLIVKILAKNKDLSKFSTYGKDDDLPYISIVMAVFNEQKIIEKKIKSVFDTNYPKDKIEFLIGSDNSSDSTNEIIKNLQLTFPNLKLFDFKERQGKVKIINTLVDNSNYEFVISTDAKVIFAPDTIFHLIEYFKDEKIAITGGVLINLESTKEGISDQEDAFMNREMEIKYNEGLIWQNSIGIYGALYAIRKSFFSKVPENFLVDDFYITLSVLKRKGKVIFNKKALAYENLPLELNEEFRRKVRISTGNFQNLRHFFSMLLNPFSANGFCFLSHKAIRWTTPLIFIFTIISCVFLFKILLYKIIVFSIIAVFMLPLLDFILKKLNINIKILRFVTHFIAMNFALLLGFFRALKGVNKSIWQPSKRN